jgi:Resolvase, N terminal domain
MIGIGMPSSQNSTPLPKPMQASFVSSLFRNAFFARRFHSASRTLRCLAAYDDFPAGAVGVAIAPRDIAHTACTYVPFTTGNVCCRGAVLLKSGTPCRQTYFPSLPSISTADDSTTDRSSGIDSPCMRKAALYARVSTDAQQKEGTIESQLVELKRQISAAGHVLVREYIDDGYSGTLLDRPALNQMRSENRRVRHAHRPRSRSPCQRKGTSLRRAI